MIESIVIFFLKKRALSNVTDRKQLNCAEFTSVEAGARRGQKAETSLWLLLCLIWSTFAFLTARTDGEEKEDVPHYRRVRKWVKIGLK